MFVLQLVDYDKLFLYGALILAVQLSVAVIYNIYSRKSFEEASFRISKDKGGSLGEVNKTKLGDSYTSLVNKAYTLKDGSYSTEAIKTDNGYHVIMRNKTYDKTTKKILNFFITTLQYVSFLK